MTDNSVLVIVTILGVGKELFSIPTKYYFPLRKKKKTKPENKHFKNQLAIKEKTTQHKQLFAYFASRSLVMLVGQLRLCALF